MLDSNIGAYAHICIAHTHTLCSLIMRALYACVECECAFRGEPSVCMHACMIINLCNMHMYDMNVHVCLFTIAAAAVAARGGKVGIPSTSPPSPAHHLPSLRPCRSVQHTKLECGK